MLNPHNKAISTLYKVTAKKMGAAKRKPETTKRVCGRNWKMQDERVARSTKPVVIVKRVRAITSVRLMSWASESRGFVWRRRPRGRAARVTRMRRSERI